MTADPAAPSGSKSGATSVAQRLERLLGEVMKDVELPVYLKPLKRTALEYIKQEIRDRSDEDWQRTLTAVKDELIPWLLTGD